MAKYKNVAISPEIHQKARLKALRLGIPLGRIVDDLLTKWLEGLEEAIKELRDCIEVLEDAKEEMRRDDNTIVGDTGLADPG